MKNLLQIAVSTAAVALFLTACGGGGGSSTPASSTSAQAQPNTTTPSPVTTTPAHVVVVPPPPPPPPPEVLQKTVPALTYQAASPEYEFVTAFNEFRAKVGLGLLAQNAQLDTAAGNHLKYITTNWTLDGGTVDMEKIDPSGVPVMHIESGEHANFTGAMPVDRAKAALYPGSYISEEVSFTSGKSGKVALSALVDTIYHRYFLMNQSFKDIGLAVGHDAPGTTVLEMAYADTRQYNAPGFLGLYPYDGQTGVELHMSGELPSPFPDLLTSADYSTKTGYPISLMAKQYQVLEVLTFTVTESGATDPLSARLMTKRNDPAKLLSDDVVFLVPNAPYKPATTYKVYFEGRIDNVLVTKTWSFTTK